MLTLVEVSKGVHQAPSVVNRGFLSLYVEKKSIKINKGDLIGYIDWSEKYSVGTKLIDDQHKTLISLVNELHEAMSIGKGKQVLSKVLQNLIDYTVSHFSTEEKYMIKFNYQWYLPHKSEHRKFVEQVSAFQKGYNDGKTALSIEIMSFLKEWLVKHILNTDKKLGSFLKENQA